MLRTDDRRDPTQPHRAPQPPSCCCADRCGPCASPPDRHTWRTAIDISIPRHIDASPSGAVVAEPVDEASALRPRSRAVTRLACRVAASPGAVVRCWLGARVAGTPGRDRTEPPAGHVPRGMPHGRRPPNGLRPPTACVRGGPCGLERRPVVPPRPACVTWQRVAIARRPVAASRCLDEDATRTRPAPLRSAALRLTEAHADPRSVLQPTALRRPPTPIGLLVLVLAIPSSLERCPDRSTCEGELRGKH